jgi:hypothetical protein
MNTNEKGTASGRRRRMMRRREQQLLNPSILTCLCSTLSVFWKYQQEEKWCKSKILVIRNNISRHVIFVILSLIFLP